MPSRQHVRYCAASRMDTRIHFSQFFSLCGPEPSRARAMLRQQEETQRSRGLAGETGGEHTSENTNRRDSRDNTTHANRDTKDTMGHSRDAAATVHGINAPPSDSRA